MSNAASDLSSGTAPCLSSSGEGLGHMVVSKEQSIKSFPCPVVMGGGELSKAGGGKCRETKLVF